jgi:hypothetical protein
VGLERGPLSLMSTIEELLGRKNSGSGLEIREYGRRDPSRWSRDTLCTQNVSTNFAHKRNNRNNLTFFCTIFNDVLCVTLSSCTAWLTNLRYRLQ